MASCTATATAIAMRAAVLGVAIDRLEVSVHSESDARGLLGMGDISAELSNMRMEVKIGARDGTVQQLEELVEWAEAHSPVSCRLRNGPPKIAIEVEVT